MPEVGSGSQCSGTRLLALREELDALLVLAQAPPVEILLRSRFVEAGLSCRQPLWESTVFPVALDVARHLPRVDLNGFSPALLDRLLLSLRQADDRRPTGNRLGSAHWDDAYQEAAAHIQKRMEQLARLLDGVRVPPLMNEYRTDAPASSSSNNAVGIVVVMRPRSLHVLSPLFADALAAKVLRLRVDAFPRLRSGSAPDLMVDGQDPHALPAFREALSALDEFPAPGSPAANRCLVRASWGAQNGILVGRSAAAAFQIAAAVARSRLAPGVTARAIAPGIAVIGDVKGTRILPVAEETIPPKIEACFYSPVRRVWLPRDQVRLGLETLEELRGRHPNRRLDIEPGSDTRELWNDPTATVITARRPREVAAAAFQWFARSRYLVAAVLLAVLLVGWVAAREVQRWNPVPARASWVNDSVLRVFNAYDNPITEIHSPFAPAQLTRSNHRGTRVALANIAGGDEDEVVFLSCTEPKKINLLSAYDQHGHKLWSRRSEYLPPDSRYTKADMQWYSFETVSTGAGATAHLLAIRKSPQEGLASITLLDGTDGHTLMEIFNRGHFETFALNDLDGDGVLEALLGGTDNGTGSAILLVADPKAMNLAQAKYDSTEMIWDTEPRGLKLGATCVLQFPKDHYSSLPRVTVRDILHLENGRFRLDVRASEKHAGPQYFLDFPSERAPVVWNVQFTDVYLVRIAERFPGADQNARSRELRRCKEGVTTLTADGWLPISAGSRFSSPGTSHSATRSSSE